MNRLQLSITIVCMCLLGGCSPMRPPVIKTYDDSVCNYRYFYVSPTGDYKSKSGIFGNQYVISGGGMKTLNPAMVISGVLCKNGFIQVTEIAPDNAEETMIVNFGESGRRKVNLGYSIEVTVQFVSAATQRPICTCTAEGQGSTEVDDVRKALLRALEPLFDSPKE